MESISPKKFLQTWLWSLVVISLLAIFQTIQRTYELEIILLRSKWIGLLGVFVLTVFLGAWLARSSLLDRFASFLGELGSRPHPFHTLVGIFLVVGGFASVWLVRLFVFGNIFPQIMPILWVFLWASLLQAIGLKLIRKPLELHVAFAIVLLAQGMLYQAYGIFSITSANPFSMGYSEAGRHYYASLFFSESLYGMKLPLPFLHPSRYLLLSIPFLVDGFPLWFHRFWQALLWFGLTFAASYLLAKRMKMNSGMTVLAATWVFLYFLQGAVYYHLQVCVILIVAGVNVKNQRRSLFFIILASLWAGISRVNWFPVPAMLAIVMYLLETPISRNGWKYWLTPFIWGASGLIAALVSQFIYIQISGNADVFAFGSSFTSDLLWDRLFPNETFPMGILPGILLVSAPLFLAMFQLMRGRMNALHPLRWLALLAMLSVLFVGGVVVSTKIGGGGDLHNMDAYLVALSLLTVLVWAGQVCPEHSRRASPENEAQPMNGRVGWGVVFAALLIPLGFAVRNIGFYPSFDQAIAENDIQLIQEAVANGGEVLFITERQLITFDMVTGVTLVPEYEQSELMEMAMSRNRSYLEQFYTDMQTRRFTLIIAEDQKFTEQKKGAFVEENVAWVRFVGAPLLCNYKPAVSLESNNLQVFEPRPRQVECKDPFSE
jgi:hypothetical protein